MLNKNFLKLVKKIITYIKQVATHVKATLDVFPLLIAYSSMSTVQVH